jgi:long-chain acyl-CoA synthetase
MSDDERQWLTDADRASALDAIRERLGRPGITPDANLELDLTLDSMERVELLTMLEQRAGTRVAPEARATIYTVRQLVDAVLAASGDGGGPRDTEWSALLAQAPDPAIVAELRRPKRLVWGTVFVVLRLVQLVLRVVLRLKVSGRDRLPAATPFILAPNHLSFLDAFVVLSVLPYRVVRQLFFVGASEYFETALMKAIARAGNVIPVDSNTNLINAMQAGSTGLREGKVLMIFPEGERSIDGQLKPFRKGTAILSAHLEAPVVPVALSGLYELWPRSRGIQWSALLPWKSAPVRVTFGDPIEMSPGDDTANTATLRAAMEQLLARR